MTAAGRILWWTLPTLAVFLLGVVHLPTPFRGDQALYSLAGSMIADGGVIHRDFWDIKHPGVHLTYALGHVLFGGIDDLEVRIHLLELLGWLGFGLFLQGALQVRLRNPGLAAGAPLVTGGAYYASVSTWHLTQIEALPGPAIAVAAWLAAPSVNGQVPGPMRSVASGVLASVAVIFHGHMWTVPLVLLGWAATRGGGLRRFAIMLGGFVGALGAASIVAAASGAWPGLWETYITYPLAAHVEVPAESQGVARVRRALRWFIRAFWPWLSLAVASLAAGQRLVRDVFLGQQLLWIFAAALVMAFETRSSWPFHFLYFLVPMGILSVYGLDALLSFRRREPMLSTTALGLAVFVCMLLPSLRSTWMGYAELLMDHMSVHGVSHFDTYRRRVSREYRELTEDAAFLSSSDARPGPIFVFGNPLIYTISGRQQALVRNGWGFEVTLQSHWGELADELANKAPVYVFLDDGYAPLVTAKAPEARRVLSQSYRELKRTADGVWLELRP